MNKQTTASDLQVRSEDRLPWRVPRFQPDALVANRPIVDLLQRYAEKENATPAQIALAWLLAKSHSSFPFLSHVPWITLLKISER